jgi:uncharacterized protein with GYD domain
LGAGTILREADFVCKLEEKFGMPRYYSIAKVFEQLGGRLLSYYVTLGEYDWLIVAEFPNEKVASSGILVAMAGGSVSNVQTTVAMTSKEAMEAFSGAAAVAKSFKSAGK